MDEVASSSALRERPGRWWVAVGGAAALHLLVLAALFENSEAVSSTERTPASTHRRIDNLRDRAGSIDVTLTLLPASGRTDDPPPSAPQQKAMAEKAMASKANAVPAPAAAQATATAEPRVRVTPGPADTQPSEAPTQATTAQSGIGQTAVTAPSPSVPVPATGATAGTQSATRLQQQRAYAKQIRARLEAHKRYPEAARRLGQRGIATLRLAITSTGIASASLASSSGSPLLDREAMAMAARAGRLPAPPHGALQIKVPVVFE